MKGKTTNGLNYKIVNQICTIEIPLNKGIFWIGCQKAQKELIDLFYDTDIHIKEFRCKKVGNAIDIIK